MDVAFDIETIGNRSMVERMPEIDVKVGNLKDPAKIAEKIAEAKADQIDRMALSPLYGRVCAFVAMEDENAVSKECLEAETDALRRRSDSVAGPFMIAPYLLTLSAAHYSALFPQDAGEFIRVPMILDMRGESGIPEETIFFNQWSMISISLKRSVLQNAREATELVRT